MVVVVVMMLFAFQIHGERGNRAEQKRSRGGGGGGGRLNYLSIIGALYGADILTLFVPPPPPPLVLWTDPQGRIW